MFRSTPEKTKVMDTLLNKMKSFARDRNLQVTWNELRQEFSEDVDKLRPHELRRLRVNVEGWLTRTSIDEKEKA